MEPFFIVLNVFLLLMFGVIFVVVVGAEVVEGVAEALLEIIKLMHLAVYCMWYFHWSLNLLFSWIDFFCW